MGRGGDGGGVGRADLAGVNARRSAERERRQEQTPAKSSQ